MPAAVSNILAVMALRLARADPTPSPDALLWEQVCGGEDRAFRSVFDRHAPGVRRFLGDLLRDASLADEGTQETFVRAHANRAGLKQREKLVPWLLGIARFVAIELRRAQRASSTTSWEALESGERTGKAVPCPGPTPEHVLLGRETERLLRDGLATLPDHRRAVLLLRLDHGLPYEDIAQAMGWSLGKVKTEIHRARQTLRAELGPHFTDTGDAP